MSKPGKIWNKVYGMMYIINLVVHLSFYMMGTLSTKFADFLGAPATMIGLISSLFALTALAFRFIAGPVIDTFNKKWILVGALMILFVSYASYILANSLSMVIIARLLTGIGLAFTNTLVLTVASDSLPVAKMGTGIGLFSMGTAACSAIAPTIGLKLIEQIDYKPTFAIVAGMMLAAALFVVTMKIGNRQTHPFRLTLDTMIAREVHIPTLVMFFLAMTAHTLNTFLVLYGDLRQVGSNIGYFFTVMAVCTLLTKPLIGKLVDKIGITPALLPSLACYIGSFLLISISRSLTYFLGAAVLAAFGFGGSQPALFALCMKSVPRERRGSASNTSFIGIDLGSLVGPLLAGVIVESNGYVCMWRLMIIPIILAGITIVLFRRQIDQTGAQLVSSAE